jgi:hypothetical protein
LRAAEAFRFDAVANGIGMYAQLTGYRSDLPMFRVKAAANLRSSFLADHRDGSPSLWNAWKRIDEASAAPAHPATQPQA